MADHELESTDKLPEILSEVQESQIQQFIRDLKMVLIPSYYVAEHASDDCYKYMRKQVGIHPSRSVARQRAAKLGVEIQESADRINDFMTQLEKFVNATPIEKAPED